MIKEVEVHGNFTFLVVHYLIPKKNSPMELLNLDENCCRVYFMQIGVASQPDLRWSNFEIITLYQLCTCEHLYIIFPDDFFHS